MMGPKQNNQIKAKRSQETEHFGRRSSAHYTKLNQNETLINCKKQRRHLKKNVYRIKSFFLVLSYVV